jgi:hypothetical protein
MTISLFSPPGFQCPGGLVVCAAFQRYPQSVFRLGVSTAADLSGASVQWSKWDKSFSRLGNLSTEKVGRSVDNVL